MEQQSKVIFEQQANKQPLVLKHIPLHIRTKSIQKDKRRTQEITVNNQPPEEIKPQEPNSTLKQVTPEVNATINEPHMKRFEEIVNHLSRTLLQIKSVFPFDFFPDEIRIEENRVNLIHRSFLASEQIHTVSLKDVTNVEVQTSLFFALLRLSARTIVDNYDQISFLKKNEALRARRIIEGLRMLTEKGVDFSKISAEDLLDKIEKLGSVAIK